MLSANYGVKNMADKALIDPFDSPGVIKAPVKKQTDKPINNMGLIDPFDAAATIRAGQEHYGDKSVMQGGTIDYAPVGQRATPGKSPTPTPLSFMDRMGAGTIDDPKAKLEYFARRRFPDDPNAVSRFGYVGGKPVYVDDDGSLKEESEGAAAWIGGNAGPIIGGVVGGITGNIPGAALGAASGEAYTKLIGQTLGDDQTAGGNAFDIAAAGLLEGLGWKLGDAVGGKVLERKVVKDFDKFNKSGALKLQKIAKDEFGIDLTPAEASNMGSLIHEQMRLGMGFDKAGDIIRESLEVRAKQVDDAVSGFIGQPPHSAQVGETARTVGKDAIKAAKAARRAASKPEYDAVVSRENLLPKEAMDQWQHDPVMSKAFSDVRKEGLFVGDDVPDHSILMLDAVKKHLGGLSDEAFRSGNTARGSAIKARADKLVALADKHFPQYKAARESFAGASPEVNAMEKGIEGVLANIKDSGLRRVAKTVFASTDTTPLDVSRARSAFVKQGKESEWNDVLNSYLRQVWEGPATKDIQGRANPKAGANFRNAVFGTKAQKNIMREAMGPDRFNLFVKLTDVLEATGRVPGSQSMTQPAQEAARQMEGEASAIISRLGPVKLRDWWVDMKVAGWRDSLAKAITSPDSIKELEKLNRLKGSPGGRKAFGIVSSALTKAGVYGPAGLAAGQPKDTPPPALRQSGPAQQR